MNKKYAIIGCVTAIVLIIIGILLIPKNTTYTVKFNTDGGTKVEDISVNKNTTLNSIPTTIKDGYTFLYWTLDGKKFTKDTKITKDITLVANWEKNTEVNPNVKKYTVTFDIDGGSTIDNIEVEENKLLVEPTAPTKEGYEFTGWTLDGKTYDFNTKVTKDITLKATWKKVEDNKTYYTVSFDTDGGSKISSKKVAEGNKVSKPSNPTKKGYAFVSWTLDGSNYDFNSKVTKNITLKATWKEVQTYTVSFDTVGGSNIANQTIEENKTASKPSNPTKDGYEFAGWTLDGKTYDFNTKVTKDITLKATWKEVVRTYTISISKVDDYSTDRYVTVKEDGVAIKVSKLMHTNGVEIPAAINGTRLSVAFIEIEDVTSFKVLLTNGKTVTATVK